MTDAERKLWTMLRGRRFAAAKFRRQVPLGPYIADFVSLSHRLVIEADGSQHADNPADRRRDRWFAENGFRVLRFWNNDILARSESVTDALFEAVTSTKTQSRTTSEGR